MRYFFLLFLCACSSSEILVSSDYQNWAGGRVETGSGTNYTFTLIAPEQENNFIITKIFAQKHQLRFKMPEQFEAGDTLKIRAFKSKKKWESNTSEAKIYYLKNVREYEINIPTMNKLENLYYP